MLVTVVVSVAATITIVLLPRLRTAPGQPPAHAALATAVSFTGLLTAVLIAGRLRRRRSRSGCQGGDDECGASQVSDAGRGFDLHAPRGGSGLALMRERVRSAGGVLRIRSSPDSGTEVEVILWLRQPGRCGS